MFGVTARSMEKVYNWLVAHSMVLVREERNSTPTQLRCVGKSCKQLPLNTCDVHLQTQRAVTWDVLSSSSSHTAQCSQPVIISRSLRGTVSPTELLGLPFLPAAARSSPFSFKIKNIDKYLMFRRCTGSLCPSSPFCCAIQGVCLCGGFTTSRCLTYFSLPSQGEDGQPGNGTIGFPGAPVSFMCCFETTVPLFLPP